MMTQLKKRITKLIERGEINGEEREKMLIIINNKRFNPYCIRHSAITSDSDYLPEYALKKKVRWSMNSRQGSRYIKTRMGNELKNKILASNGIISENEIIKKPTILTCPRCEFVNVIENKFCSKCIYSLKPEAYDELKITEENRIKKLEEKYDNVMKQMKDNVESKLQQIISKIDLSKV